MSRHFNGDFPAKRVPRDSVNRTERKNILGSSFDRMRRRQVQRVPVKPKIHQKRAVLRLRFDELSSDRAPVGASAKHTVQKHERLVAVAEPGRREHPRRYREGRRAPGWNRAKEGRGLLGLTAGVVIDGDDPSNAETTRYIISTSRPPQRYMRVFIPKMVYDFQ